MQDQLQANALRRNVPAGARRAITGQIVRKQKSYYSTIRFQFALNGGVLSINKGTRLAAFSYGINEVGVGGFDPSFGTMTEAETNILTRNDTGGSTVNVYGISLYLGELSDAYLAKQLWSNVFCDVTLNGSDRYALLGRLGRIPAAGGLQGAGVSRVLTPATGEPFVRQLGSMTNGHPEASNYLRLNEPLVWGAVGTPESKFAIRFEVARTLNITLPATAAPYTQPAALAEGTFVDLVTYLHTIETTPRSTQQ